MKLKFPNRSKYKFFFKKTADVKKLNVSNYTLKYGTIGLKSCMFGKITPYQLESFRKCVKKKLKKKVSMWLRIFPDKPMSKKPLLVRMGSGKGAIAGWCYDVKKGTILFELDDIPFIKAKKALRIASAKLPILTKIIKKKCE